LKPDERAYEWLVLKRPVTLNGSEKLQDLIDGIVFVDGERIAA